NDLCPDLQAQRAEPGTFCISRGTGIIISGIVQPDGEEDQCPGENYLGNIFPSFSKCLYAFSFSAWNILSHILSFLLTTAGMLGLIAAMATFVPALLSGWKHFLGWLLLLGVSLAILQLSACSIALPAASIRRTAAGPLSRPSPPPAP